MKMPPLQIDSPHLLARLNRLNLIVEASIMILSAVLFLLFELNSSEGYKGESFPVKYLWSDDHPKYSDVDFYLQGLNRILGYFSRHANETDINRALGTFFMKAILKRTMKDYKNKIQKKQQRLIHSVILQAEDILSHFYSHSINSLTWADTGKRIAFLLKDEYLQIEAIGKFKRHRFQKWILSDVSINDFERAMDELKLPKEIYLQYTEEVLDTDVYTIYTMNIDDSDYCLGEIIYHPTPQDAQTLKPCVYDKFCSDIVYKKAPSFSYSLSHRMLNIMVARHLRRCYMRSAEDDAAMMEALCSSMYREAVYLARRGYFNRDMWMEHIALCGLLGYEEFFRRHWFRKVVSWIDERGCIAENFNYEANRTRYLLAKTKKPKERRKIRDQSKNLLAAPCHWHPMAVGLVVLAHGVRHGVHFTKDILKYEL